MFKFPVGEMQVNVEYERPYDSAVHAVNVTFTFTKNEDIIELMLFVDACKRQGMVLGTLTMPYVPFSRQDRKNAIGESFSLAVFCNLINSLNFFQVVVHDPHSDVTPALLNNCFVREQHTMLKPILDKNLGAQPFYLVSPDAGALKKIYKLAKMFDNNRMIGVIECGKKRDTSTGDITGTVIYRTQPLVPQVPCVMIDDICDGGRTFVELGKALKAKGAERVHLYVTHGFFTKGLDVFNGIVDVVDAAHFYPSFKS
jgi:ribose-phosphate pyrophosphokinase